MNTEPTNPELSESSSISRSKLRRVAIIGVHGVAHHDPGETTNAMADLLLSLPSFDPKKADEPYAERGPREFDHFEARGIQIPLQPVCLKTEEEPGKRQDGAKKYRVDPETRQTRWRDFRLQEGSYKFALHLAQNEETVKGKSPGEIGRWWSVKLLQDYYGAADSNKYVTTRLEGQRVDSTEVHIYEMFWADLAKPTNSLLSLLLALFQFVLHVPSLSSLAIDTKPTPDRMWRFFQSLHRYARRMLQMALPLAKVMLLIVVSSAIPAITHVRQLDLISAVVAASLVAILSLLAINYRLKPVFHRRTSWIVSSFLLAIAAGVGVYSLVHADHPQGSPVDSADIIVLAIAISLLGAGLMWWALKAYQTVRPGILGWGWSTYLLVLIGFAIACYVAYSKQSDAGTWLQLGAFWTAQWVLMFLRLSWIALALLAILSSIVGALAWRMAGRNETSKEEKQRKRSQAKAAVRTSRFALAMPAFLFVLITSLIWAALFSIEQKIVSSQKDEQKKNDAFFANVRDASENLAGFSRSYFQLFPDLKTAQNFSTNCDQQLQAGDNNCPGPNEAQPDYLKGVLAWSVGLGSYIVVLVTLAGLIILAWWALPSVLTETFPTRRKFTWYQEHGTEPPRNSTNRDAMWMGTWISRGLDSISVVTWLSWLSIFLIPLFFMYVGPPHPYGIRAHSEMITRQVVYQLIVVAATTAIFASLVHYSSPVLRVILDVDTYLRSGPIEATPRAKIFERYVSLLRHIAKYRGADGKGYDRVVIVAHSLGALISGDLLNLLQHATNHEGKTVDTGLEKFGFGDSGNKRDLPLRLFTMGNPVRQLLNRFFPYLYDWVREAPDNGSQPLGPPPKQPPAEFDSLLPDPADLGVEKWVSAYRSGDYVGRSLWLNEWYKRSAGCGEDGIYPERVYKVGTDQRVEFCIGAGAHTHYWDDTAPDIAEALNELI